MGPDIKHKAIAASQEVVENGGKTTTGKRKGPSNVFSIKDGSRVDIAGGKTGPGNKAKIPESRLPDTYDDMMMAKARRKFGPFVYDYYISILNLTPAEMFETHAREKKAAREVKKIAAEVETEKKKNRGEKTGENKEGENKHRDVKATDIFWEGRKSDWVH